jgi:hypothetical protein
MPFPLLMQCREYAGKPQDFVSFVIEPVLSHLTEIPAEMGAAQLLLGTALHESGGLVHRVQMGGGPARGLFQMEPNTHDDIWNNFLKFRKALAAQVLKFTIAGEKGTPQELTFNDNYAAAMCRVHYYRYAKTLPALDLIDEQAKLWKKVYNTPLGKGTVAKYKSDWEAYKGDSVTLRLYTPK